MNKKEKKIFQVDIYHTVRDTYYVEATDAIEAEVLANECVDRGRDPDDQDSDYNSTSSVPFTPKSFHDIYPFKIPTSASDLGLNDDTVAEMVKNLKEEQNE